MFYERRQNFGGQFTPEWFVNTWHTRHQPQPTVLVIQVPQRITGYGMQSYGFGLPQKPNLLRRTNFQINHKSSAQKFRDFKRRQTFLERKIVCSSLPGAELSDREFTRLFCRPVERHDVVNTTLISSLQVAEKKLRELQNELEQLKALRISEQQRYTTEREQMQETVKFHEFNSDLFRLKNADLEERDRLLLEGFDLVNTACCKLLNDKDRLMTLAQRLIEQTELQNQMVSSNTRTRRNDCCANCVQTEAPDAEQQNSNRNSSCEWCVIVKAFYEVCMPK